GLGELRDELAAVRLGEAVDQLRGQCLEAGDQVADEAGREGGVHQPPQTVVLLALLVEDPAVPPAGEGTFGHPVVRGPGDAALAQFGVLEEAADVVVAQDGQTVVGAGVPAAFAGLVHGGRGGAGAGAGGRGGGAGPGVRGAARPAPARLRWGRGGHATTTTWDEGRRRPAPPPPPPPPPPAPRARRPKEHTPPARGSQA